MLVAVSEGYSLVAVWRFLIVVAFLVSCLRACGIKPMSQVLAGRFLTTGLPGKS